MKNHLRLKQGFFVCTQNQPNNINICNILTFVILSKKINLINGRQASKKSNIQALKNFKTSFLSLGIVFKLVS